MSNDSNETSNNDVSITVQGNDIQLTALIGGVIDRALTEAGFTDVANRTMLETGHALASDEVPTMLEMARQRAPEAFAVAITIDSVKGGDDEEGEPEDEEAEDESGE